MDQERIITRLKRKQPAVDEESTASSSFAAAYEISCPLLPISEADNEPTEINQLEDSVPMESCLLSQITGFLLGLAWSRKLLA